MIGIKVQGKFSCGRGCKELNDLTTRSDLEKGKRSCYNTAGFCTNA